MYTCDDVVGSVSNFPKVLCDGSEDVKSDGIALVANYDPDLRPLPGQLPPQAYTFTIGASVTSG